MLSTHATQLGRILQETFPGRIISRRGEINSPPRSCDLTIKKWSKITSKIFNTCNTSCGGHLNDERSVSHMDVVFTIKKKYHERNILYCVLFTFTFETTKWIIRHYSLKVKLFLTPGSLGSIAAVSIFFLNIFLSCKKSIRHSS